MPGIKAEPLRVEHFKPRMVRSVYGRYRVHTVGRGKGGLVVFDGKLGCLTTANARKLAEAIHDAADHLDGGVKVMPPSAKCRCGSKKDLKMVQHRQGHNRSRLGWGPPLPLCPKCREIDRGIFRYCPTRWGD
jgi:hypothetical protein